MRDAEFVQFRRRELGHAPWSSFAPQLNEVRHSSDWALFDLDLLFAAVPAYVCACSAAMFSGGGPFVAAGPAAALRGCCGG